MAVVGVPKTIDNDILLMDKTFGFDTAVEEAQRAINSAYIEVELLNLIAFMFVLSHALSLWYNQIRITFWNVLIMYTFFVTFCGSYITGT